MPPQSRFGLDRFELTQRHALQGQQKPGVPWQPNLRCKPPELTNSIWLHYDDDDDGDDDEDDDDDDDDDADGDDDDDDDDIDDDDDDDTDTDDDDD